MGFARAMVLDRIEDVLALDPEFGFGKIGARELVQAPRRVIFVFREMLGDDLAAFVFGKVLPKIMEEPGDISVIGRDELIPLGDR